MLVIHNANLFFLVLVILSGFFVLARGDWRSFKLKFAGVVLSTVTAAWMLAHLGFSMRNECDLNDLECVSFEIYGFARSAAIICFHMAIGRDAIIFKSYDRRAKTIGKKQHGLF